MESQFGQPAILLALGFLVGIMMSKVIRYALAVCALAAVIAGALVLLGKANLLTVHADIALRAIALSAEIVGVLKGLLQSSPWLLAGALGGVLLRELIALLKRC